MKLFDTSTLGSTFFPLLFFFSFCITVYEVPFLADDGKDMAVLLFIF